MTALFWIYTIAIGVLLLGCVAAIGLHYRRRSTMLHKLLQMSEIKLEQMQRQFESFVPAEVVERLTNGGDEFMPEKRHVTMLFADLRGFTALCDQLDPAITVNVLNDYFSHMNRAIIRHHGHINELVGDGLLALFGALEPNPWQSRDAVLAALEMRVELARYNETLRNKGLPELRFGVGIHRGEVVAGIIGTAGLSKFSVTGDPINVASRIEGLASKYQVDVLVSEEVRGALDVGFVLRAMPPSPVKGKSEPIQTYFVEAADPKLQGWNHSEQRLNFQH